MGDDLLHLSRDEPEEEHAFGSHQGCVIASEERPATGPDADDGDRYDALLHQHGRFAELLARHRDALRGRVSLRVPQDDVDDVLQNLLLRLVRELRSGRCHAVPFRVVAHRCVDFAVADHFRAGERLPRPDGDIDAVPAPVDGIAEVDERVTLEQQIAALRPGDAQVMRMRWLHGMEIADIARHLGRSRNAVDQALHRGRAALRKARADGR